VAKPGRNEPCLCGSGRKYKRCCIVGEIELVQSMSPPPRFINRAVDLKRATLDFIDDCSRTLRITSNATGTAGMLPSTIPGEAIREIYQRIPSYFPHGSSHASLLGDLAARPSRGVYLGPTTPQTVLTHLTRHSLYNEHIIVPNPFCDLTMYQPEVSPVRKPERWRQVTANQTMYLLMLRPWIEADIVTCLPPLRWFDPVFFDQNLVPLAKARFDGMSEDDERAYMAEETLELLRGMPPAQGMYTAREMVGIKDPEMLRQLQELLSDPIANPPSSYAFALPEAGESTMVKRGSGEIYESAALIAQGIGGNILLADRLDERAFRKDRQRNGDPISEVSIGLARHPFAFLNAVDLDFALGIRKDGRLDSLRKFLVKLWDNCATPDKPATDDFNAELTDQYRRYESEWKDIDYKLAQRASIAAVTTGAAVIAGTFGVNTTLLGGLGGMILTWAEARYGRRVQKRNPLSIFLDLERVAKTS